MFYVRGSHVEPLTGYGSAANVGCQRSGLNPGEVVMVTPRQRLLAPEDDNGRVVLNECGE